VMALFAGGCATTTTWCFRVIDSQNDQPLSGVSLLWGQRKLDWHEEWHCCGSTNLPPSQADGLITVLGVHPSWDGTFRFTRPGYSDTWCSYEYRLLNPHSEKLYFHPTASLYPTNGIVDVRMSPL
jgi:hypothetical protein